MMKRMICAWLALILMLPVMTAALAEGELAALSCAEEHFSTKVDPGCSWEWVNNEGLYIYFEDAGYMPYILVSTDASDSRVTDGKPYFEQTLYPLLKDTFGQNGGTMMSIYGNYTVAGRDVAAVDFQFRLSNGVKAYMLFVIDVRDDCSVYYRVRYVQEENRRPLLDALETIVANFQYDPDNYEGMPEAASDAKDTVVSCPQLDFSALCDVDFGTKWEDGQGLYVYTWGYDTIPYVLVGTLDRSITDLKTYIHDEHTPNVQKQYGPNSVSYVEYEYYDVGGKKLPAAQYNYIGAAGDHITMLQVFDMLEDRTVKYTAKYVYEKDREVTLATLDDLVATFHPGANYYSAGGASGSGGNSGPAPSMKDYTVERCAPIVTDTYVYKDSRFCVELPVGWQVRTSGMLANDFCLMAWDPAQPDRYFFRTSALYPFVKSAAAKDWWTQNVGRTALPGINVVGDAAVVLEEKTLACFLSHANDIRQVTEALKDNYQTLDPEVFPAIRDAVIQDTAPSPIFRIPTAPENLMARITFTDDDGDPCEGVMTAQPSNDGSFYVNGIDIWPDTVYMFMGFAAPVGELRELESVLSRCLSSFTFSEDFIRTTLKTIDDTGSIIRQMNATMLSGRASYDALWENRTDAYDVLSQKWSDATLGYDRLYDSETGEVYRAETGFWDEYELHRYEYDNPNLQLIDSGTEQYYLRSVDYTISR